jgi:hypothetical protein
VSQPQEKQMIENATLTEHTVAVFVTHDQAEAAVKSLNSSGYNMKNLSIMGQNYATDEHPVGFVNTGDRMWTWGKFGAFWGWIWGLLFGSAMIFVPGMGPILFAGWIVSGLEGAIVLGGVAALGGALTTIGIPANSIVKYESALKAGSFLLVAHGAETDVKRAKDLLATTNASSIDSFSTRQPVETH